MKKILVNTGRLTTGGLENMVVSFAENTINNYEYYFIVHNDSSVDYKERLRKINGKIIRVNSKNIYRYIGDIKKVIKQYGPFDIVHSHTLFFSGIILAMAKFYKIPIRIAHSHNTCAGIQENIKNKIVHKILGSLIKINGNVFCACGEKAGQYLYGKKFWNERGTLIENGIDTKQFIFSMEKRAKIRRELAMNEKDIIIGQVGRIALVKNLNFTIKVFQKLIKNNKNIKLLIIGDGPLRISMEEKVNKMGLGNQVLFLGNVDNMNEIYSALDILVLPSLYEGFPVVLVEAQTNGLKCLISDKISKEVILTDLIKMEELIEELWVKDINKIITQLNPEHRSDYIKLLQNYDIKNVAKKIEEIYEK